MSNNTSNINIYGTLVRPTESDKIVDGSQVEGGYFVCETLPVWGTKGQLCYNTTDSKFYQYNDSTWVIVSFASKESIGLSNVRNVEGYSKTETDTLLNDKASNTDLETVTSTVNETKAIALGKAKAVVFDTVDEMTSYLKNATKEEFKIGDNLYIRELNVPDYWISTILDDSSGTYGYYEIAQLETQKVDLSNLVTKDGYTMRASATIGKFYYNTGAGEKPVQVKMPTIPSKTSQLTNDSDFVDKTYTYSKTESDDKYLPLTGGTIKKTTTSFDDPALVVLADAPVDKGNCTVANLIGWKDSPFGLQMKVWTNGESSIQSRRIASDEKFALHLNPEGGTVYANGQQVATHNDLASYVTTNTAQTITGAKGFAGPVGNTQSEAGVYLGLDENPGAPNANIAITSANSAAYIDMGVPNKDYGFRIIKWNNLNGNYDAELQYGDDGSGLPTCVIKIPREHGTLATQGWVNSKKMYLHKVRISYGSATFELKYIIPQSTPLNTLELLRANANKFIIGTLYNASNYLYVESTWDDGYSFILSGVYHEDEYSLCTEEICVIQESNFSTHFRSDTVVEL